MKCFCIFTRTLLVVLLISSFLSCAVHHTLETQPPRHLETGPFENPSVVSSEANPLKSDHYPPSRGYTSRVIFGAAVTATILIQIYLWTK